MQLCTYHITSGLKFQTLINRQGIAEYNVVTGKYRVLAKVTQYIYVVNCNVETLRYIRLYYLVTLQHYMSNSNCCWMEWAVVFKYD